MQACEWHQLSCNITLRGISLRWLDFILAARYSRIAITWVIYFATLCRKKLTVQLLYRATLDKVFLRIWKAAENLPNVTSSITYRVVTINFVSNFRFSYLYNEWPWMTLNTHPDYKNCIWISITGTSTCTVCYNNVKTLAFSTNSVKVINNHMVHALQSTKNSGNRVSVLQHFRSYQPPDILVGRLRFYRDSTLFLFFALYPRSSLNGTQQKPDTCSKVSTIWECMSVYHAPTMAKNHLISTTLQLSGTFNGLYLLHSSSLPGFADGHQQTKLNQTLPNGGQ